MEGAQEMNQNSVAEALRALADTGSKKSEASRLWLVFDEVERAFAAGISRESMLETLHAQGFKMTLRGLDSALYRLRKKREKSQPSKPGALRQPKSTAGIPAATPQVVTPRDEGEGHGGSEETTYLSPEEKEAKRKELADRFVSKNSLANSILKGKKP